MGMAHYIPLDVYKRVRDTVPMAAEVFPEDAFEAAMQSLIRDCALEFKKHFGNQHKLAFICDDGPSAHLILDTYPEELDIPLERFTGRGIAAGKSAPPPESPWE